MRGPLDVHRLLLGREVPHEIVQLRRRISTADELPAAVGAPSVECAVAHVVVADGRPSVVVLAAGRSWSPTRVARAVRARAVRQADAAETSALTEYSAGLVAPLALPDGVRVLVDADLAAAEVAFTAVGSSTRALRIRTRDLLSAAAAQVDALVAPAAGAPPIGVRDPWPVPRFAVPAL